jgi:hypothetical protein
MQWTAVVRLFHQRVPGMSLQRNDIVVFEHLHHLLDEQGRAELFERRKPGRKAFQTVQLVAECSDDPNRVMSKDFEKRECFDISTNGIAYFSPHQPTSSHVTIAIGSVPLRFILATVRHAKQLEDGRWLVGCQFVKKLN